MPDIVVQASVLTAESFAPFGEVIEASGRIATWINRGTGERFADLAEIDVLAAGGRPTVSIVRAAPRSLPLRISLLERHPLSSQAFVPLDGRPFLVVVAHDRAAELASRTHAFFARGNQGINYRRNIWHHPLIALETICHFLAIERSGTGQNCEEMQINDPTIYVRLP